MVFGNQHKDIIDIDFYLLYQFQLKDDIIHNTVFVTGFWLDFLIYVMISTRIILKINRGKNLIADKTVEGS